MPDQNNQRPLFQALGLAWELGYTIAVPLVIFALGGRFLDRALGTSPWLLMAGVVLSIAVTSWLVYRKVSGIVAASDRRGAADQTPKVKP